MDPALALRGFILGFTIAAAVGPISLLVIRRTLAEGQLYGLVSGLGVATADATYGAIAAFGLGAITDVAGQRPAGPRPRRRRLPAVAGVADHPFGPDRGGRPSRRGAAATPGAYLSILGLTLANPMTILSFGALFAGLGVTSGATGDAALVVARRAPRLGDLVGRADDRRRRRCDARSRRAGSAGSTSSPASSSGRSRSSRSRPAVRG